MSVIEALERLPRTAALDSFLGLDQAVLEALPIGVYVCDAQGRIVRVNSRAIELWGQSPQFLEAGVRFCGSFRVESLEGELIPPEKTPMARAVLGGESLRDLEAVVENPDGKRWIARVNVSPLRDAAGAITGAINCFQDVTAEHELKIARERERRTFDLAMIASRMGTWRYTLADNVCTYDENAQNLYGLAEPRFVHDEAGTKAKFHLDDMDLMWARVAKAVDPAGDGRYEVEYRVKQPDGSWRWLSAWGLTEFEGRGKERRPVAIAGASRDLTERKRAEELQQLLMNELNHRVKNTLATMHSIANQTLRGAHSLQAAQTALSARILSLAESHDLLMGRRWLDADVADVVARVIAPFAKEQFQVEGASLTLLPKQVLALSMALHELATNALKYGALSKSEGRIGLQWTADKGRMNLVWRETGGPPVVPPSRQGFGSRLLKEVLHGDLGGEINLEFAPEGVRCSMAIALPEPAGFAGFCAAAE